MKMTQEALIGYGIVLNPKQLEKKFGFKKEKGKRGGGEWRCIPDILFDKECDYHFDKIAKYKEQLKETTEKNLRKKLEKKIARRKKKKQNAVEQSSNLFIVKIKNQTTLKVQYFIGNLRDLKTPWFPSDKNSNDGLCEVSFLERIGFTSKDFQFIGFDESSKGYFFEKNGVTPIG